MEGRKSIFLINDGLNRLPGVHLESACNPLIIRLESAWNGSGLKINFIDKAESILVNPFICRSLQNDRRTWNQKPVQNPT